MSDRLRRCTHHCFHWFSMVVYRFSKIDRVLGGRRYASQWRIEENAASVEHVDIYYPWGIIRYMFSLCCRRDHVSYDIIMYKIICHVHYSALGSAHRTGGIMVRMAAGRRIAINRLHPWCQSRDPSIIIWRSWESIIASAIRQKVLPVHVFSSRTVMVSYLLWWSVDLSCCFAGAFSTTRAPVVLFNK